MYLDRLITILTKYEAIIAGILLAVSTLSIGIQLFSRMVFNVALPWPEELCVLSFIYLSFFGAGALYKSQGHLCVDYFVEHFIPNKNREWIDKFVLILNILTFSILLFAGLLGLKYAMKAFTGSSIRIPRGYYRIPIFWMCITNILASINFLLNPKNKENR